MLGSVTLTASPSAATFWTKGVDKNKYFDAFHHLGPPGSVPQLCIGGHLQPGHPKHLPHPLHCVYCLRHPFPHSHVHYSEGLYNSYGELQMRQSRGSSTNAELRKLRREQRRRRHLSPQAFSLSREKGDTCSAPKERVLSSHVLLIRLNCAG